MKSIGFAAVSIAAVLMLTIVLPAEAQTQTPPAPQADIVEAVADVAPMTLSERVSAVHTSLMSTVQDFEAGAGALGTAQGRVDVAQAELDAAGTALSVVEATRAASRGGLIDELRSIVAQAGDLITELQGG